MDAEPFEERPVFKIVAPFGIEWVRFHPDLDVPPDFDLTRIKQVQPHGFFFLRRIQTNGEHASSLHSVPVPIHGPGSGLSGMPAFRPAPEALEQHRRYFLKRPRRHNVTMVIGPTPNQRVELTNELHLAQSASFSNTLPHLGQKDFGVLFGGPDEQFFLEFADVLAEEVEPLREGRDAGFLP